MRVSKGFDPANHTQVPNDLFDQLPELTGAELKILLIILRKTRGWHKETDRISYTQLQEFTGLGREAVSKGITGLKNKGLITIDDSRKTHSYEVNYITGSKIESVRKSNRISSKIEPVIGSKIEHTKETTKETNKRKGARVNGCPVPDSLQQPEIVEAYQLYCNYMKENWHRWPTSTTTQMDLAKLQELQASGNDPVKVIQQTIHGRNKSFFELRNFQKNGDADEQVTGKKYQEL